MLIVQQQAYIAEPFDPEEMMLRLERRARVCYKSEHRIEPGSAEKLLTKLLERGHLSIFDHETITAKFICDRGISHEIVRHRIAAYSQESTRYCNYSQDRFGNQITVIDARPWLPVEAHLDWVHAVEDAEQRYLRMIERGAKPEMARTVLPEATKTELDMTADLTEWRHVFKLRCSDKAHPQMRDLMKELLSQFKHLLPVIFGDL